MYTAPAYGIIRNSSRLPPIVLPAVFPQPSSLPPSRYKLTKFAMRRPITLAMVVVAVFGGGVLARTRCGWTSFPSINAPQIYVVNNYAGMGPEQIEGIVTNVYEQNFQYVDGFKAIESKSIQNFVQLKLTFYPGTDMAAAMSQVGRA